MATIDGRTSEGRFLRRVRAELTTHIGGRPSTTEAVLIDRCAWLRLRIAAMDASVRPGQPMNEMATRTYLAWTASLARLMRELGPAREPIAAKPRTLAEIRASQTATRQTAA